MERGVGAPLACTLSAHSPHFGGTARNTLLKTQSTVPERRVYSHDFNPAALERSS